jgi:hypothetical protein
MVETLRLMGQPYPRLFGTDNPFGDKEFFLRALPSLLEAERVFNGADAPIDAATATAADAATATAATTAATATTTDATPDATELHPPGSVLPVDMGNTHLHSKQDDINAACLGFRDELLALSPKPIVALDAEWDTLRNGRGEIVGKKGRVALVILSARVAPESYKTLLLRTHNRATLPVNLVNLLMDRRFTFTGRCIGADFSKLSKDFSCDVHSTSLLCDIGPLARSRNLCHSSTTLEDIVLASTGFRLPKDQAVRCSMWSARDLSADQLEYAARDGVASIMAHHALQAMPNHSCRLACDKADFGCLVDLVPATGSVAIMNSCGARGTLLPRVPVWTNPAKVGARSVNLTATRHV